MAGTARSPAALSGNPAAVLIPIFKRGGEPHTVFTRRPTNMRRHAGEISFPGGRRDPGDRNLQATALREAQEEIGLDPATAVIIDALDPVNTRVTGYVIHPFVATVPDGSVWTPNPAEVAEMLELPLAAVKDGFAKRTVMVGKLPLRTDTYCVDGNVIWGATARILGQLFERGVRQPV